MSKNPNSTGPGLTTNLVIIVTALCVICFVVGTAEFAKHYPRLSDAAFHSLQLFHLHFPEHLEEASLPLDLVRWCAALLGLSVLPVMLGLLLGDRLFRYWVRLVWRNHVIVCGDPAHVLQLVSDLRSAGRRVVVIGMSGKAGDHFPAGVLHLEGDPQEESLLRMASVHRAAHLVALSDDLANLGTLDCAMGVCMLRSADLPPLECHAHIQDAHLEAGLRRALTQTSGAPHRVSYHLFNLYEEAARLLACRYPLPEALVESAPLPEHYVIVGFGAMGQHVALKLVKMGQQLVRERNPADADRWRVVRPQLTVVDPRGEEAAASFLHRWPAFSDHCEFRIVPLSGESPGFLDLSFLDRDGPSGKTSVILCTGDEPAALRTAILLREGSTAKHDRIHSIYLRLRHPDRLKSILEEMPVTPGKPRLTLFASDREIFSADSILRESLDTLARAVHEAWLTAEVSDRRQENQPTAAGKAWEELDEQDRDSNREAADHTWAKLRTLGYELQPADGKRAAPGHDAGFLAELKDREEELARAEHYRWMTWRLLDGWTYGKQRDRDLKHHPDILPYEELAKSTQEKDKVIIRAIPALIRADSLTIKRIDPVGPA